MSETEGQREAPLHDFLGYVATLLFYWNSHRTEEEINEILRVYT